MKFCARYDVRSAQQKILRVQSAMRSLIVVFFLLSAGSCGSEQPETTHKPEIIRSSIGNTGYTIQLLPGYTIEKDPGFEAYYFKPVEATLSESEAGFYLGPKPDTAAPMIEYSKRTFTDAFLQDTAIWTEYTTSKYIQREVFIDLGTDQKIHCWCYSRDASEIDKLWAMVKTISKQ